MSVLKKPYEISLWTDECVEGKYAEKRLMTIGSSTMTSQNRAFDPELTQNINGSKKLTFKMYKQYIDTVTGEQITNPFEKELINERKVKLFYDGDWFDFIIKNKKESSTNYLYIFELEDAHYLELSKNGFDITLGEELENNSGDIVTLAEKVLEGSDWSVDTGKTDRIVEKVSEVLVKTIIRNEDSVKALTAYYEEDGKLKSTTLGEIIESLSEGHSLDWCVYAFYSSYYDKPYRVQFITIPPDQRILDDTNHVINATHYFIDGINVDPENNIGSIFTDNGEIVYDFRAYRIGYVHKQSYLPKLKRYAKSYQKISGDEQGDYYAYEKVEYKSPSIVQNILSSYNFKSISGWVEATTIKNGDKATASIEYGYFNNEEFQNCTFEDNSAAKPWLKLNFPSGNSAIFNTGPKGNRYNLGNMVVGQKYRLECKCAQEGLCFELGEYEYDPTNGIYIEVANSPITFTGSVEHSNGLYSGTFEVTSNGYNDYQFKKKSQVCLKIMGDSFDPDDPEKLVDYYIEKVALYQSITDESGNEIKPADYLDEQTTITTEVVTTYRIFSKDALDNATDESDLVYSDLEEIDNSIYKPIYTDGSKIRNVRVKESNYANNLHTLAEQFECWAVLDVKHDENGYIGQKRVYFKKDVGQNNYANFRYGVNLKDIQRTYQSKDLVTKLIVKENTNEFAPSGFCSIAKSTANPTGETSIYDFSYYFKTELMDAEEYYNYVYDTKNTKGYYSKIKEINEKLAKNVELITNASIDLINYKAELEVAEAGLETVKDQLEELNSEYENFFSIAEEIIDPEKKEEKIESLKDSSQYKKMVVNMITLKAENNTYTQNQKKYEQLVTNTKEHIQNLEDINEELKKEKLTYNQEFFKKYSRFIQEGTWIDEEYMDDNLYYYDALSTLYNSCFPQIQYTINVLELSQLPGYEHFTFKLGDKTNAIDPVFFDMEGPVEVVISEKKDNLDDPSKNSVRVQNYKNQFQDLFQKITATTQQLQYSTGSYERAAALVEADKEKKYQFLSESLNAANARLQAAGQQSVVMDERGLTVSSVETPSDTIRLIGGAILLSKEDENGVQKWTTAVTADGITADVITTGVLNTGEVTIMTGDEPAFYWNAFGLNAFSYDTNNNLDRSKFVRFDKDGLYGIHNSSIDGYVWKPENIGEIEQKATFSLTWEGLKVVGTEGNVTAKIGKEGKYIINVKKDDKTVFGVNGDGVEITGKINATGGQIGDVYVSEVSSKDYVNTTATNAANELRTEFNGKIDGTIKSVTKQYYLSTSNQEPTGGSWSNSPVDFANGQYLWVRNMYTTQAGNIVYGEAVLDTTFTTISQWCDKNDKTLINGANIATGTLSAEKITTGVIKSQEYSYNEETGYSNKGTAIDLDTGYICSQNFAIDKDGNLKIRGYLDGTEGTFSGTLETAQIDMQGGPIKNIGELTADTIEVKSLLVNDTMPSLQIEALTVGGTTLEREESGTSSSTVTTTYTFSGTASLTNPAANRWSITFTVTASASLPQDVTVQVIAQTTSGKSRTQSITIKKGTRTASRVSSYSGQAGSADIIQSVSCVPESKSFTTYKTEIVPEALKINNNFCPATSGDFNLGSSKLIWNYVYRRQEASSSDRKLKNNIVDINDDFSSKLINGLQPKSYSFKTAKTPRTHYGFIAQDVEELLHNLGTSADEVGLVCKSLPGEPDGDDNIYLLNYTDFMAPMVNVIQQLSKRVNELELIIKEQNKI